MHTFETMAVLFESNSKQQNEMIYYIAHRFSGKYQWAILISN